MRLCAWVCMWVRVCTSVCACVWAQWSIEKVFQSSRKSQRNSEIPFDSSSGRNKWLPLSPSLSFPLLVSFYLLTHFSVCHSHLNPSPFSVLPLPNPIWFNQFVYSAAFSMSASTMSTNKNECQSECESLNLNSSNRGKGWWECTLFNTLMNLHKYII